MRWTNITYSNALAEVRNAGCHATESITASPSDVFVYRATSASVTTIEPASDHTLVHSERRACCMTITGIGPARTRTMHEASDWNPGR